jgi:hypothetical protein
MRKRILVLVIGVASLGLVAFTSSNYLSQDKREAAQLAWDACNEPTLLQKRANLAAQASSLDKKWVRLSDAANFLAGAQELSKNKTNYSNASGNDAMSVILKIYTMSAQFTSECTTTFK